MSDAPFLPERVAIDAYGNGGFRFRDLSHKGSLLCLPGGVYGWPPLSPQDLQVSDFAQILECPGKCRVCLARHRRCAGVPVR